MGVGRHVGSGPIRISEVARRLGIHPQTLRLYDRAGLVRPQRSAGNVRRYSGGDVDRLREILALTREQGVNLSGVGLILELRDRLRRIEGQIESGRRHD